jgi:hypothetical protein
LSEIFKRKKSFVKTGLKTRIILILILENYGEKVEIINGGLL